MSQAKNNLGQSINFSGIVVCYNEAHLLRQCLESIDFCQEIIIVDLGSTDNSLTIANEFGAKILYHDLVPYPNLPRQYGFKHARHEWIITIDPDEVFPKGEIEKIKAIILEQGHNLAGIRIPWQFYFRGKELKYSVWGRPEATWCVVVHRERIQTTPYVHKEFTSEQNIHYFSRSEIKPLQHYWMSSYRQLFRKMWRYSKTEGKSKYESEGKRFSWFMTLKYTAAALKVSLIDYRGLFGGFTGIFLSFFHAWYVLMSWLSLRQYERRLPSMKT
jgi:glycosyltransferase involved in cell wall biosynthesis